MAVKKNNGIEYVFSMSLGSVIKNNLKEIFILVISGITAIASYLVASSVHPVNELAIKNASAIESTDESIVKIKEDIDISKANIYTICGALAVDCEK